jgi:hypothetical protein
MTMHISGFPDRRLRFFPFLVANLVDARDS